MLDKLWEGKQSTKNIYAIISIKRRVKNLGFPTSMLIFTALNYNILKQIQKKLYILSILIAIYFLFYYSFICHLFWIILSLCHVIKYLNYYSYLLLTFYYLWK